MSDIEETNSASAFDHELKEAQLDQVAGGGANNTKGKASSQSTPNW